jgi:hypothetical protein
MSERKINWDKFIIDKNIKRQKPSKIRFRLRIIELSFYEKALLKF